MSGDWTLMQTAEGAIALLLDDQIVTLGQAHVENPNSNNEVRWNVHLNLWRALSEVGTERLIRTEC